MPNLRLNEIRWRVAVILTVVAALVWAYLFIYSVVQRHKAERFLADMKSFPFDSAGINEVGSFVERHGGLPIHPALGHLAPTCNIRDCDFEVSMKNWLIPVPEEGTIAHSICRALMHVGIRPWVVASYFTVRGGKLQETSTTITQLKFGERRGSTVLMEIAYDVITCEKTQSDCPLHDQPENYMVAKPFASGFDADLLDAWVSQGAGVPMSRVFDVDLRCMTSLLHPCRDFAELAPSAWADHAQRQQ